VTSRARASAAIAAMIVALSALSALSARSASADETTEGFHHRWDRGDLYLELGAGGGVAIPEDGSARGLVAIEARARVIDMAGPVLAYRAAPNTSLENALILGVEVRPFFPALVLTGASSGSAWLDLFVESIGVELGAAFALDGRVRPAFVAGTSIEAPLYFPELSSTRLSLRLAARHVDGRRSFRNGDPDVVRSAWDALATLCVAFPVRVGIAGRQSDADR
jgi:hypothetical protein